MTEIVDLTEARRRREAVADDGRFPRRWREAAPVAPLRGESEGEAASAAVLFLLCIRRELLGMVDDDSPQGSPDRQRLG